MRIPNANRYYGPARNRVNCLNSQVRRACMAGQDEPERRAGSGVTVDLDSPAMRVDGPAGHRQPQADATELFRFSDGTFNYLGRMNADGSGRTRVTSYPIATVQARSPDRRWIVAITPRLDGGPGAGSMAIPTSGGDPVAVCRAFCYTIWSPDGKYLYIEVELPTRASGGKLVRLPVPAETGLPALPSGGLRSVEQALALAGSQLVEPSRIVPSLDAQTYAFLRSTVHRNLFRLSTAGTH